LWWSYLTNNSVNVIGVVTKINSTIVCYIPYKEAEQGADNSGKKQDYSEDINGESLESRR
jgi:hypothetical protein